MVDLLTPAEIEPLAAQAGLSLTEVCRRAGLAQSTFTRWRAGKTEPTLDAYRRLRDAVLPTGSVSYNVQQVTHPMHGQPTHAAPAGLGEPQAIYESGAARLAQPNPVNQTDPTVAEAAQIFARINRELAAEEARADWLLRLYNL